MLAKNMVHPKFWDLWIILKGLRCLADIPIGSANDIKIKCT